jgi:hypothetical protein
VDTKKINPGALLGCWVGDRPHPVIALGPQWVRHVREGEFTVEKTSQDEKSAGVLALWPGCDEVSRAFMLWAGDIEGRHASPVTDVVTGHLEQVRNQLDNGEAVDMTTAPDGWEWTVVRPAALMPTDACVLTVRVELARQLAAEEAAERDQRRRAAEAEREDFNRRVTWVNRKLRDRNIIDLGNAWVLRDSADSVINERHQVGISLDVLEALLAEEHPSTTTTGRD